MTAVRAKIMTQVRKSKFDLRAAFEVFDADKSGSMLWKSFVMMKLVGVEIDASELDALMACFDANGDGFVDYDEFCSFVKGERGRKPGVKSRSQHRQKFAYSPSRRSPSNNQSATSPGAHNRTLTLTSLHALEERIRRAIDARDSSFSLVKYFSLLDSAQGGRLRQARFEKALKEINVRLLPGDLAQLLPRIDPQSSGKIDYALFCELVGATDAAKPGVLRQRVKEALESQVARGVDLGLLFRTFDTAGSGAVHEKDVARALAAVGVRFSKAELRALVSMLDKDKNGCVEIADFMDVLNIEGASSEQAGSADPDAMAAVRSSLKKSGANVYEAFDRFDRFGTGRVSRRSFRAACGRKHLRLGLSERALRSLMERFADSDGAVDYASFSKQAESDIGSRRVPRIIEDVSNALRGSAKRRAWP